MENQNEQTRQSQNASVLMAGVAGIIAGAAGITALALSDKDIRKSVSKKAKELRITLQDWSSEKLQLVNHQKIEKEKTVERVIDNTKEDEPHRQEVKISN